ncbi:unnamed protein product [Durusdinium trenchii]
MARLFMNQISSNEAAALFPKKTLDPCLGVFEEQEDAFGTCNQPHDPIMDHLPLFVRPLRYLDCSACNLPGCKVYATAFTAKFGGVRTNVRNRLILAVPGACTHGDVLFRLLPRILSKRSHGQAHILSEVTLHHFKPGDKCEHHGQPGHRWSVGVACFLMLFPSLLKCFRLDGVQTKQPQRPTEKAEHAENASIGVDIVRAIAIWNTCCFHWQMKFPFDTIRETVDHFLWPDDPSLKAMLRYRLHSALEGLYSIITVFLVLRCTSSKMFGQRLMRKVGRQFVVMLFIDLWRPVLLFASSPVNCIQDAIRHPTEDLIGSVVRIATASHFNWAIRLDMQEVLLVGTLGVLRFKSQQLRLGLLVPAASVLYWAYLIQRSLQPDACDFLAKLSQFGQAGGTPGINLHYSFWLHWFPNALILLNLDTCLRSPHAIAIMARLKRDSFVLGLAVLLMLLGSFALGTTPMLHWLNWEAIGFINCDPKKEFLLGSGLPYVIACLPFEITAFAALHLALVPRHCQRGSKIDTDTVCNAGCEVSKAVLQPVLPFLSVLEGMGFAFMAWCKSLREIGLAFLLWHYSVMLFFRTFHPAWASLHFSTQKSSSPLETQLLFFAPMAIATWSLAWFTHHIIEKPYSLLFRTLSEQLGQSVLLTVMVSGYMICCSAVWWTSWVEF